MEDIGISREKLFAAQKYSREGEYWLNKFSGQLAKSFFPYDFDSSRKVNQKHKESVEIRFPANVFSLLMKLSNGFDYTLHMIFVSAVMILLEIYTENEDIIIGAPIYKQDSDEEYVNTVLALRNRVEKNMTFKDLLVGVRQTVMEADENQNYPIERLLYNLDISGSEGSFPLFDVAVLLNRIHDKIYIRHIPLNMIFYFTRESGSITAKLEYNPAVYRSTTAERILKHFIAVQQQMLDNIDGKIAQVRLLTEAEKQQLLKDFNDSEMQYPIEKTLVELFTEQVQKSAGAIALEYRDSRLSYGKLHERAGILAACLREKGVKPGTIVGIMIERSVEMMVGIIGIIIAGGAYLPINIDSPGQRIAHMLNDSGTAVLLTSPGLLKEVETVVSWSGETVFVEEVETMSSSQLLNFSTSQPLSPSHLAYVIYTSGSTGLPKAALIRHANVHNLLLGLIECIYRQYKGMLKIALLAPYFFDASVKQIFAALLQGFCLSIIPEETRTDGYLLLEYYAAHAIDVSDCTPTHLLLLLESCPGKQFPFYVKHFIAGGEPLPEKLTRDFLSKCGNSIPKITNIYGVTECTVDSTFHEVTPANLTAAPSLPIGKPMCNTKIHILDKENRLRPVGVTGELCIAGHGVGRGYLNRPEQTAEKFVKAPAASFNFHRSYRSYTSYRSYVYKTGDLARWLPDGNIEFHGRLDHQVKIRGYRLELGEIENSLLRHPQVKNAVVLAKNSNDGDRFLCAYVMSHLQDDVAQQSEEIENSGRFDRDLREYLSQTLPEYMMPSFIIPLEEIPLTVSGKVNRRALPEPEIGATGAPYAAPRDAVEQKLVHIWADVLKIEPEKIGIDVDFFEIGGHSLRATILISRIHKTFDTRITLQKIFEKPTVRGIAGFIKDSVKDIFTFIKPAEKRDYYPLSPAVKRLYLEQQLHPESTNYNITMPCLLTGNLDKKRLEQVFKILVSRHETLRTFFISVDDEPVQRVQKEVKFEIEYFKTGGKRQGEKPGAQDEEQVANIIEDFVKPFDLALAPLFRVTLIKTQDNEHGLIVGVHHMAADGSSVGLIMKDFMLLYGGDTLPALRIRYKDYSKWKYEKETTEARRQQEKYWLAQFAEEVPVLNLPGDYARPAVKSSQGLAILSDLGLRETKELKELAMREDVTLYMVMLALFNILLAKLTGLEDIVIGTPAAGRSHADLEPLLGMFVNTLAMRNYPVGSKTFLDFLSEVKENILRAFENQEYNFEELVQQVVTGRDISRSPLFDVFFALQNMEIPEMKIPGLSLRPYEYERKVARFDLSFILQEDEEQLQVYAEYCTELFKPATINRFIEFFKSAVLSVINDPSQRIWQIEILSWQEKQQVLYEFNDTYMEYPREKTIPQLFAEQVNRVPDNIAVGGNGQEDRTVLLSYKELNRAANRFAAVLSEKGVRAGVITGLMLNRSLGMIPAILGILQAGGAYLPIEPVLPAARLRFMLTDSNTKLLLTSRRLKKEVEKFRGLEVETLFIEEGRGEPFVRPSRETNVGAQRAVPVGDAYMRPENLAYVIYTSGTTGKPKAILTGHANVSRVVKNTNYIKLSDRDRLLQLSNYAFDGSVFDIYGALLNGASLILVKEDELMVLAKLAGLIEREAITVFFVTTALFNALIDEKVECLKSIRKVLFGGERVSVDHTCRALDNLGPQRVIHVYGPTETTVYATYYFIKDVDKSMATVPIGKPISNTTVHILDKYFQPAAIGVPGEIHIGGNGLARGYLNRPELSAEMFVTAQTASFKPQAKTKNISPTHKLSTHQLVYRSGDLARWLPDGNIEFLDRIDQQVKIRGFRIELGEIESKILTYEGIKEAAVLALGKGAAEKYLCAYIVADQDELDIEDLHRCLSKYLPGYMIPSYFINLEKLPLTVNGKLDKKTLPEPEFKAREDYTPPRDELEEKLVNIWCQVFFIDSIGIDDNFFELGGHSLKATLMISRIHRLFNVNLSLVEFFRNPTIRSLAACVSQAGQERQVVIEPAEEKEIYPLSAAQNRMFFIQSVNKQDTTYNIPVPMLLVGEIDLTLIEEVFTQLVQRHESLRTSFLLFKGEPVQRIHRPTDIEFKIEYREQPEADVEEGKTGILKRFIRPFDLSRAPLLRVGLIKTAVDQYVFIVDMHHSAADGTSLIILVNEFIALYQGANKETLPALRIRYRDYSQWQNSRPGQEITQKQQVYWVNRFKGEIPILNIPGDYPRPETRSSNGANVKFEIGAAAAKKLRSMAIEEDATLFMVLLTLFNVLLFKLSGQEDIIVGTVTAGRRQRDLENIVGMFINTLALRNFPREEKSFIKFLREVRQTTLEAFDNEDYQFDDLVEKALKKRSPGRNPLFDVLFMFGQLDLVDLQQAVPAFTAQTTGSGDTVQAEGNSFYVKPYRQEGTVAKFDILFRGSDTGEKLAFSIGYCTDIFKEETILRFIKYFKQIVAAAAENEKVKLKDISVSYDLVIAKSDAYRELESNFEF